MSNQPVDTAKGSLIDGLKGIAINYIKAKIMERLIAAAPWLFGKYVGWLANPIIGFFMDRFLIFLLDRTILGVALLWIAVDVQYDVKSSEDATVKLKLILSNPEAYTAAQTKLTLENFDEEAVELIRIGLGRV